MRKESVYDGIYGLAIGDAIGVPAEFKTREELSRTPIKGITGYGTHYQRPGTWSDDTSLSLCTLDSLSHGLDYTDIMERFRDWSELGIYTPYGKVFNIGMSTDEAIARYIRNTPVLECGADDDYSNGKGSLMRILPVAFFIKAQNISYGQGMEITADISSLTHAHLRAKMACCIYVTIALNILDGKKLEDAIKDGLQQARAFFSDKTIYEFNHFINLFSPDFKDTPKSMIQNTGYVVYTLEACLWSLLNSSSYKEAVLTAVNLGDDTDTVAAVTGGLAGLYYTREGIPEEWIEQIARPGLLEATCDHFIEAYFPEK